MPHLQAVVQALAGFLKGLKSLILQGDCKTFTPLPHDFW